MRVLHTIPGLSATLGGPSTCTCDLMNALYKIEHGANLLTLQPLDSNEIVLGRGEPWLHLLPNDYSAPFTLSHNFNMALEASEYDIYHCNGLWVGILHSTCAYAREKGKPYVLSPHGMLYPNALRRHYWKKWPMLKLWYSNDIKKAACLHATCEQEARYIRDFGYRGPIAIIGNAAVMPEYATLATSKPSGRKTIGYLGRLHPIKRVERILYGLAICEKTIRDNVLFCIMGKGDEAYETFLRSEIQRLGIQDNVEFVGFVCGRDKYSRLRDLWCLMVPSESENFGMIVPEALISGTPVYASLGTPWQILHDTGCGWWEDSAAENIAKIVTEIVSMHEDDVLEMGRRGRTMVEEHFAADAVARQMHELYMWLLNRIPKPDFIV